MGKFPGICVLTMSLSLVVSSCGSSDTAPDPYSPPILQETLTGAVNAMTSPLCSNAFILSVEPSYYREGSGRCVEFRRMSATAGIVRARLTWDDRRLDLDLVLNDGVRTNFRQATGANKGAEQIEAFVNAGTTYIFVVYLVGVDPFVWPGGPFPGDVATSFSLSTERPR